MLPCKDEVSPLIEPVDEGWGIPQEESGPLIRAVPNARAEEIEAAAFDASVLPSSALDGGWNLAEGTEEYALSALQPPRPAASLPVRFCPAPLESDGILRAEQQEEFSKPDLALGTDVDLPPPTGLWFAELTEVVPKRRPKAVATGAQPAKQEVNIRSCFSDKEDAFFVAGEELSLAAERAPEPDTESPKPTKSRWWRRKRR